MQLLIQILQLLACLSLLVIVHEFGHFITAKIFGVRVEKFYLFFNPGFSLLKWKPKNSETEYGIGWLPFGGYVKLAGMIDESLDTDQMKKPVQDWEFRSKPAWQRLIIMLAGVVMNFIAAIVIYSMVLFTYGESNVPMREAKLGMDFSEVAHAQGFKDGDIILSADGDSLVYFDEESMRKIIGASQVVVLREGKEHTLTMTSTFMKDMIASKQGFASYRIPFVVREVITGGSAESAGLQAGDSIVGVNDTIIITMDDSYAIFQNNKNDVVKLNFYRAGLKDSVSLTLDSSGRIGVYVKPYFEVYPTVNYEYGFFESFPAGIEKGVKTFTGYGSDMKMVFSKEGVESLGGFGTITSLFPKNFSWAAFWYLTAYISVILAFMNVLPIPALDGGHILFLLYEIITRKKLSQEFMIRMQKIGLFILLLLLLYANGMDIFRAFR